MWLNCNHVMVVSADQRQLKIDHADIVHTMHVRQQCMLAVAGTQGLQGCALPALSFAVAHGGSSEEDLVPESVASLGDAHGMAASAAPSAPREMSVRAGGIHGLTSLLGQSVLV